MTFAAHSCRPLQRPCSLERFQFERSVYPQCWKQFAASLGVTLLSTDCISPQSDSCVLHLSERSACLILANTISIGLRSGL